MIINEKQPGLHTYKAFYNRHSIWLYAKDLWDAKQKAIQHFKASKRNESLISVLLHETADGNTVTQVITN